MSLNVTSEWRFDGDKRCIKTVCHRVVMDRRGERCKLLFYHVFCAIDVVHRLHGSARKALLWDVLGVQPYKLKKPVISHII